MNDEVNDEGDDEVNDEGMMREGGRAGCVTNGRGGESSDGTDKIIGRG